jgi:hypothetical protein
MEANSQRPHCQRTGCRLRQGRPIAQGYGELALPAARLSASGTKVPNRAPTRIGARHLCRFNVRTPWRTHHSQTSPECGRPRPQRATHNQSCLIDWLPTVVQRSSMARTITIKQDFYELLVSLKAGPRDSFSNVIRRHIDLPPESETPLETEGGLLDYHDSRSPANPQADKSGKRPPSHPS